jgi:nucleoside-diphosphate-sugar epimerase
MIKDKIINRVLVTGGAGYVGSVLTRKLLTQGYGVKVVDCLRWGGEALLPFFPNPNFEFINGDLRDADVRQKSVEGIDAIVHLAAIVGDPACKKDPALAEDINWNVSKQLFDLANAQGVSRFIFASTCSNYGKMPDSEEYIDEEGELNPISLYAKLKVRFENYLLHSEPKIMAATSLRFSTACGLSQRMRFDLTVNEFVKDVFLGRELVVFGEQFWRPYCHTEDLAQGCICVLEADRDIVDRNVFNVGDTTQNYQKQMIVDLIKEVLPQLKVRFVHKDEDPRDYKVNFDKINKGTGFQNREEITGYD